MTIAGIYQYIWAHTAWLSVISGVAKRQRLGRNKVGGVPSGVQERSPQKPKSTTWILHLESRSWMHIAPSILRIRLSSSQRLWLDF